MENTKISPEIAKLLHSLKFKDIKRDSNQICLIEHNTHRELIELSLYQVQSWLRDNHSIHITVGSRGKHKYTLMLDELTLDGTKGINDIWSIYYSYEFALENGIIKALTYLKQHS